MTQPLGTANVNRTLYGREKPPLDDPAENFHEASKLTASSAGLELRVIDDLARSLRVRRAAGAEAMRAVDPTRNTAAYQAYLQGRFMWNQRSEPALRRASRKGQP